MNIKMLRAIVREAVEEAVERVDTLYLEALNLQHRDRRPENFTIFHFASHGSLGKTQLLRSYYDYYWSQVESCSFLGLRFTTPSDYRKWLEQQLQQVGITLPEETYEKAYYVNISAMSQAMQVAKRQEESFKIELQRVQEALRQYLCSLAIFIFVFKHVAAILRRFVIAQRRLQYVAAQIHNRVARSPSPFRHEPPVGGVKVGGKFASFVMSSCGVSVAL